MQFENTCHAQIRWVCILSRNLSSVETLVAMLVRQLYMQSAKLLSKLQVMVACFQVFATWEEEYEKLQTLLRDMAKKKREEHGKAGRVNPSHKRSQARLDYVRK